MKTPPEPRGTSAAPRRGRLAWLAGATASLFATGDAAAAPPWGTPQMQPGISIVTCAGTDRDVLGNPVPASASFVCGLLDLRNPTAPLYGTNGGAAPLWNPPMSHEANWTAEHLGIVFGTEIDKDGDMYLAAGGLYPTGWGGAGFYVRYGNLGGGATSLAAAGTVYKIDRNTGVPSVFTVLPQQATTLVPGFSSGPGLGNIAYDADFDQFFITNMEDGKIYRVGAAGGAPIGTAFDPLTADNGAAGMPPIAQRLWGISVFGKKIYYAVWNTGNTTDPGKIRRVDLDGTGAILPGTDVEILTVPGSSTLSGDWNTVQAPVGDIEMSADGKTMILAQRTQRNWGSYIATSNHAGKVFIAKLTGATWAVTNTLETGNSWGHGETYGGTDFGMEGGAQEKVIWASSADLAGPPGPHGLQGTRPADFPVVSAIVPNCFKVPYDPAYTTSGPDYKGVGGDVDIMQESRCAELSVKDIRCPDAVGGNFSVSLSGVNNSGQTAAYIVLTPCLPSELTGGAITVQPLPSGVLTLATPVPNGGTFSQNLALPFTTGGNKVCFRVTLLNETGAECCTEKICIDVPRCDCAEIIDKRITCEVTSTGLIKYTIDLTIKNRTNFGTPHPFAHAFFLPPAGFSPSNVTPTPNPIPPGGTGVIHTCYYGLPGKLCFNLSLHAETLADCCSLTDVCLDLPDCTTGHDEPDTCELERRVPCCPSAAGGVPFATAHFTICNNSTVPRTYTWTTSSKLVPPCTKVLAPSAFAPPGGTIGPVPPGGCVTVPIMIRCEGFAPGECASYTICTSFDPLIPPVCCTGVVFRPKQGEVVVKPGAGADGLAIGPGETKTLRLVLANDWDTPISGSILLSDELGILGLAPDTAGERLALMTVPFSIPARGSVEVPVSIRRYDDGFRAPDFTSLQARLAGDGSVLPIAEIPIQLLRPDGATPRFAIGDIRTTVGPVPALNLTVQTFVGKRYRVQESSNLVNWVNSECTVVDAEQNPDGTFNGTGGQVTCTVTCSLANPKRFYQVTEVP